LACVVPSTRVAWRSSKLDAAKGPHGVTTPKPNTPRRYDVFVSYSSADRWIVARLVGFLRASGTKVFLAVDSIRAGTEWEKEVLTSLVAARRVFVFWSVNAAASEWVQWEYTQADDRGIPVIPVALDATPMPAALSSSKDYRNWLPCTERSACAGNR
jgi:hypothetical protein